MRWAPPRLDRAVSVVTVAETAAEVGARGGRGIPLRTDHTDDRQVEAVFEAGCACS